MARTSQKRKHTVRVCACVCVHMVSVGRVGEEGGRSKIPLSLLPRGGTQEGSLGLEAVSSQEAKSTRTTSLPLVAVRFKTLWKSASCETQLT